MIIDNKARVIKNRKMLLMQPIILILLIAILLFSNIWIYPIFGVSRYHVIVLLCIVYVALVIVSYIRDYGYFYFNNQGDSLVFRYYSLKPFSFNAQHKQIEIKKESFKKYELQTKWFGLKECIIIYQKVGGKIAKYPSISISAISKDDKNKLVDGLKASK